MKHLKTHPRALPWFQSFNAFHKRDCKYKIDENTYHLLKWFISSNTSASELENLHLRVILKKANIIFPGPKTFSKSFLPNAMSILKSEINAKLQNAVCITLITDIWTNKQMIDFIGLAACLVNSDFQKEILVIDMIKMSGAHNHLNIKNAIETMVNKFDFDKSRLIGKLEA